MTLKSSNLCNQVDGGNSPEIKNISTIYTMEYYSAMKKNEIMTFVLTRMNLEIILPSKVRQKDTDTIWYHLYVESKIWHKWTYLWKRNKPTDIENRLVIAEGEGNGEGKDWEFGMSRCKLLYIEWINNKALYCTGNYIQYPVINHSGKE